MTEDQKALGLRRMQRLTTGLLLAMLLLLGLSSALETAHPWLHWVRAAAEAGAVGAMADWYAVVALFRRPLGLPIPHSAIIPKNKDRIGASLGRFVEQNFLTPDNILRKLEPHNVAQGVARWLADPRNSRRVAQAACDLIPGMLAAGSDEDLQRLVDRSLRPMLLKLDVSAIAGHVLGLLTRGGRQHAVLNQLMQALEAWLEANRGLITAKFGEASRYTPPMLDAYIVGRFVEGIVALLHEVAADPEHVLRQRFDTATLALIEDLKTSPDYRRRGRALLRQLAAHVKREGLYRLVWDDLRGRIEADLGAEDSVLRAHVAGALERLGQEVLDDPAVQQKLNAWWLETVRELVLRFRHEVSALIEEVVRRWDADDISRKVEQEIGRDLQFIRINGTVVGASVGLILHAVVLALS